jgi:2-polyprenyl-6-hydroxyphenyl methylase/3-demethylubiquinone-9 3-methyltransferase
MIRKLLNSQMALSRWFDQWLPSRFRTDGNADYMQTLVPKHLNKAELTIYDVGGGKTPYLSVEQKTAMHARVVGIDIDHDELSRAPEGAYDEIISADITKFRGRRDADVALCQALLEHVQDVNGAFEALSSILKPEGRAIIFVPSRNSIFARLNLLVPQKLKQRILYGVDPGSRRNQGFPAFYDRCTPADFRKLATEHGFEVEELRTFYMSTYFFFFFPAYVAWRAWILFSKALFGDQAAETFSMVIRKTEPGATPRPQTQAVSGRALPA